LYDQFGGGNSGRAGDITEYTVDRHVRDLKEIIDNAGRGKVVLIGQSWGAILASIFASRYPDKIEGMILTCPGPIFPVKQERASIPAPDSIKLTKPVFTNSMGNKMTQNLRMKVVEYFATHHGWTMASDHEADAYAAWSGFYVDRSTVCDTSRMPPTDAGQGYYTGLRTFRSLTEVKDFRDALRRSRFPVLVLKGECDNQSWGFTSEYLEIFPNSRLRMISGAGHFLWMERPEQLREEIGEFIKKVD
jgi:proline iminopeptidase